MFKPQLSQHAPPPRLTYVGEHIQKHTQNNKKSKIATRCLDLSSVCCIKKPSSNTRTCGYPVSYVARNAFQDTNAHVRHPLKDNEDDKVSSVRDVQDVQLLSTLGVISTPRTRRKKENFVVLPCHCLSLLPLYDIPSNYSKRKLRSINTRYCR